MEVNGYVIPENCLVHGVFSEILQVSKCGPELCISKCLPELNSKLKSIIKGPAAALQPRISLK